MYEICLYDTCGVDTLSSPDNTNPWFCWCVNKQRFSYCQHSETAGKDSYVYLKIQEHRLQ